MSVALSVVSGGGGGATVDAKVVVMCARGGSMDRARYGLESRSLKAAHLLQQAGYTRVMHLQVGLPYGGVRVSGAC